MESDTSGKDRTGTMDYKLEGKTAIVTGAGKRSGIGFAIVEKLASCGAATVIADLVAPPGAGGAITFADADAMNQMAADMERAHGAPCLAVDLDITSADSIAHAMALIKDKFKRVDILVNNAGTAAGAPNPVVSYNEDAWLKTMDVNLHGTFRMTRAAVPLMAGRPGSIINMASRAGKAPVAMNGAYCVSKAAVIMLTRITALELAPLKIRANALCPGLIMTDLQQHRIAMEAAVFNETFEQREKELQKRVPLGYLAPPAEVAAAAAFLAGDESRYITGQAINVCGGQIMEL